MLTLYCVICLRFKARWGKCRKVSSRGTVVHKGCTQRQKLAKYRSVYNAVYNLQKEAISHINLNPCYIKRTKRVSDQGQGHTDIFFSIYCNTKGHAFKTGFENARRLK